MCMHTSVITHANRTKAGIILSIQESVKNTGYSVILYFFADKTLNWACCPKSENFAIRDGFAGNMRVQGDVSVE